MTLKTLFQCDFNVKTKSHLPISKKGMTKIPLPKKTSLAESLKGHSHAILVHFKNKKYVLTSMKALK